MLRRAAHRACTPAGSFAFPAHLLCRTARQRHLDSPYACGFYATVLLLRFPSTAPPTFACQRLTHRLRVSFVRTNNTAHIRLRATPAVYWFATFCAPRIPTAGFTTTMRTSFATGTHRTTLRRSFSPATCTCAPVWRRTCTALVSACCVFLFGFRRTQPHIGSGSATGSAACLLPSGDTYA